MTDEHKMVSFCFMDENSVMIRIQEEMKDSDERCVQLHGAFYIDFLMTGLLDKKL